MTVDERFDAFLSSISLTKDQLADGRTKHEGVSGCLNRHYYDVNSPSENRLLVGSWGKHTRVRPPRDIDVLFILPTAEYWRFEERQGNKQAQLLQEVKDVLAATYPTTDMRADGQVVMVPFASYSVEVAPAFALKDSTRFWICDTNGGGRYKTTDPRAEIAAVDASDTATNKNTRALVRMLKTWQRICSVPLKSFILELLAIHFLSQWQHAGKTSVYYDWMVRDFLDWVLRTYTLPQHSVVVPGTKELIPLGSDWRSRAETALGRAKRACDFETKEMPCSAGEEWQKIFGNDMPWC